MDTLSWSSSTMRGEKAGIDGERKNTMKRLLSAALAGTMALSLLGATAASAQPYGRGGFGHGYGYARG